MINEMFSCSEENKFNLLISQLNKDELGFYTQDFNKNRYKGRNIIVDHFKKNSAPIIIASAHYDGSGAYDNNGGVATLFYVLKWLKFRRLYYNILGVFFDGEEKGLLGAKAFLENYADLEQLIGHISLDGFGVGIDIGCFGNLKKIKFIFNNEIKQLALHADTWVFQYFGIPSLHCFSLPTNQLKDLLNNNIFPPLWYILHTQKDSPLIIEEEWIPFVAFEIANKIESCNFKKKGIFRF